MSQRSESQIFQVFEMYTSILGDSVVHEPQGIRASFIRLSGCNLKCRNCDCPDAIPLMSGKQMHLNQILDQLDHFGNPVVCITGGEPLIHPNIDLLVMSLKDDYSLILETNGTCQIPYHISESVGIVYNWRMEYTKSMRSMFLDNSDRAKVIRFEYSNHDEFTAIEEEVDFISTSIGSATLENMTFVFSPNLGTMTLKEAYSIFSQFEPEVGSDLVFSPQIQKLIGIK